MLEDLAELRYPWYSSADASARGLLRLTYEGLRTMDSNSVQTL